MTWYWIGMICTGLFIIWRLNQEPQRWDKMAEDGKILALVSLLIALALWPLFLAQGAYIKWRERRGE